MKRNNRRIRGLAVLAMVPALATLAFADVGSINTPDDARSGGLESLRKVVNEEGVPLPNNLSKYVKDMTAAAQLGKALFHDQAVGSDAVQACVTCHFNAGADSRSKNQVSPGLLRVNQYRKGMAISKDSGKLQRIPTLSSILLMGRINSSRWPIFRLLKTLTAIIH